MIAQVSDGSKPYNVGDDNFANRLANCDVRAPKTPCCPSRVGPNHLMSALWPPALQAKFRKTGSVSRARVSCIDQTLAVRSPRHPHPHPLRCLTRGPPISDLCPRSSLTR